ncbi:MAG: flagellar hook-basal body complex protein FliE [Pseudomonadota bacterium]
MDIRSQYALRGYEAAKQSAGGGAATPQAPNKPYGDANALFDILEKDASAGPTDAVKSAAQTFVTTVMEGEKTANAAIAGKADALSMVEALAAAELAMETAVTVRDKVVEAYQEILRMPV